MPTFRTGLGRLRDHAARSADLAREAGCSARTIELIRNEENADGQRSAASFSPPTRRTSGPDADPRGHGQDRPDAAAGFRAGSGVRREGLVESSTHVKLDAFDGPLALLLAVIEARQLDVLTVPLGGLAAAYLDALATLEGDRLGNVSAFVAVAAQLILIKSRAILPRPPKLAAVPLDDELDPEAELRARLLEYKRFRDAGAALGEPGSTRIVCSAGMPTWRPAPVGPARGRPNDPRCRSAS
jgi:hypothetical protein